MRPPRTVTATIFVSAGGSLFSFGRPRAGFTLLELLVVGMLGVIVLGLVGNAGRWYGRSMHAANVDLQLSRELKIAAETIAADFGPALAARTVDGSQLQLNLDSGAEDGVAQWDAPDTVIEYVRQGTRLLRKDLAATTELTVAEYITAVEAEVVSGHLQVKLTAGFRGDEQDVTLELREVTP
jgi:type II secretory pathway component PulJ